MRAALAVLASLALAAPALAQVPAAEREQGAAYRARIVEQFGGTYTGPGYAETVRVGRRMAVAFGLSRDGSDCTVTLLNSTIVNAFATPGCYIYTTRGLLAIVGNEAELASVLGHEIGHVSARHAQARETRSVWTGLGAALASVLTGSETVARVANGLRARAILGFSREQENQADALGVKTMIRAGYDPREAAAMLRALAANDALMIKATGLDPERRMPTWARSHPLTADRIEAVARLARASQVRPGDGRVARDDYLASIDGMLWGDDPAQGYIDGRSFAHPTLRIAFTAPRGFVLTNSPRAVTIASEAGHAQFAGGPLGPREGLDGYVVRLAGAVTRGAPVRAGPVRRARVNGIETALLPLRADTGRGPVDIALIAYRAGPYAAYQFVTLAPAGKAAVFDPLINSCRRLTEAQAAALRPRVLRVVTLGAHDTVPVMAARMAFAVLRTERFLALNGLAPGQPLHIGERIKIIEYAKW